MSICLNNFFITSFWTCVQACILVEIIIVYNILTLPYPGTFYNLLTFKVGGRDWINFLALPASFTTKVYKFLEPLTLNLVCLKDLPALFCFLLTLTVATLTSFLLVNSKNCLMSVISLAIFNFDDLIQIEMRPDVYKVEISLQALLL